MRTIIYQIANDQKYAYASIYDERFFAAFAWVSKNKIFSFISQTNIPISDAIDMMVVL